MPLAFSTGANVWRIVATATTYTTIVNLIFSVEVVRAFDA